MKTDQFVAVDRTVMFQSLVCANLDLGTKAAVFGVDWGANNCGKTGINSLLPSNDQENPIIPGVIPGAPVYPVEFASLHRSKLW
jgi:hypothetical protein